MNEPTHPSPAEIPPRRHEPEQINIRAILICAGALALLALVIHIGAWGLFRYLDAREERVKPDLFPLATEERLEQKPPPLEPAPTPPGWSATRGLPPPPREPQLEGIKRMEGKDGYGRPEQLSRYEWVDRKDGIVQIPLDQAMKLIVEEGLLPARSSALNPLLPPWQGGEKGGAAPPSRANSGRTPEGREP
jgi:hypothetical protein